LISDNKATINNPVRQRYGPTLASQFGIETLTHHLHRNSPSACVFQYVGMTSSQIPPYADVNVQREEEVVAQVIPPTIPELVCSGDTPSWTFSAEQVIALESLTQGQAQNSEWIRQRVGRITASNMHTVMAKVRHMEARSTKAVDYVNLLNQICVSSDRQSNSIPAIKYGRSMEPEARQKYVQEAKKKHRNLQVHESGLCVVAHQVYVGASPDGLVRCDCCGEGVLEIKCPFSVAHTNPEKEPPVYIVRENGSYRLRKTHPYYSQTMAQMGATNRKWCDFFVYSKYGFINVRIPFDESFWTVMLCACEKFFVNHVMEYIKANAS
jgi:hypothetical protein